MCFVTTKSTSRRQKMTDLKSYNAATKLLAWVIFCSELLTHSSRSVCGGICLWFAIGVKRNCVVNFKKPSRCLVLDCYMKEIRQWVRQKHFQEFGHHCHTYLVWDSEAVIDLVLFASVGKLCALRRICWSFQIQIQTSTAGGESISCTSQTFWFGKENPRQYFAPPFENKVIASGVEVNLSCSGESCPHFSLQRRGGGVCLVPRLGNAPKNHPGPDAEGK